ncbi:hypothetical protein Tsubulata_035598 [Turnera subulata]|uniref:F-box protein At3g26010-like beta-propeller domain-containing protein n=1 Tax=Turnera subulata TaxID=218843 RepID=A0A9Q0GES2_9ROSI|nr:hypothetical protein Tsubulata_035598 [Turnera subulata]
MSHKSSPGRSIDGHSLTSPHVRDRLPVQNGSLGVGLGMHYLFQLHADGRALESSRSPLASLPETAKDMDVVASHKELLLCWNSAEETLYVCNPCTQQWITPIPPPPVPKVWEEYGYGRNTFGWGFFCEPWYRVGQQGDEFLLNAEFRYRIFRFERVAGGGQVLQVYSSETCVWNEHALSVRECNWSNVSVEFKGKLHWYNPPNIVVFDPFNPAERAGFIGRNRPDRLEEGLVADAIRNQRILFCLGVCRGCLQLMSLAISGPQLLLSIWEVEDDEDHHTGKPVLTLNCRLDIKQMLCRDSCITTTINTLTSFYAVPSGVVRLLAFHPRYKHILYFNISNRLVACNLQTQELYVIGRVPIYCQASNVFQLVHPLWPTPLPIPTHPHTPEAPAM